MFQVVKLRLFVMLTQLDLKNGREGEKLMGLFSRLFAGKQNNAQMVQTNQPQGFNIVRYEYGEEHATKLFQKAEAGDVNAQLVIAKCFKDSAEHAYALPWYEKAAAVGNAKAFHELTYFYEGRYVGIEADPVKAEQLRNMALEKNHPKAFLKLASQYYTGSGVEEDKQKAFEYYMKAAELGDDEAMAEVGACFFKGDCCVQQDAEQAFYWLSRSKDASCGYYYLAQCYIEGIGTVEDVELGIQYLEHAVEHKCVEMDAAREQLVDLYSKGYGGPDAAAKLEWMKQAIAEKDRLMEELVALILEEQGDEE